MILHCYGIFRMKDNEKALGFAFNRKPTDDEMRFLKECMDRAVWLVPKTTEAELICPKCKRNSGDDWSECDGKCPMTFSPHYKSNAI